jgi:hypothetical protein
MSGVFRCGVKPLSAVAPVEYFPGFRHGGPLSRAGGGTPWWRRIRLSLKLFWSWQWYTDLHRWDDM